MYKVASWWELSPINIHMNNLVYWKYQVPLFAHSQVLTGIQRFGTLQLARSS